MMLIALLWVNSVSAISPTPQMLEQFKNLPKSEQQRLARQYGIDPALLSGIDTNQPTRLETPQLVTPRPTSDGFNTQPADSYKVEPEVIDFTDDDTDSLKRFGYELFAGAPTTFAPVSDAPVPAEYLVGPGDNIKVQLYGKENKNYDLVINRDGVIQFPELGPVNVNGLTFSQLRESLTERIKQQMIGIESNITMGELRSIRIFVAGDAYKPGSYTVSSLSSMTQALFVAGGINEIGSLRNIQLKRNGNLIGKLDLYDLLIHGDASGDKRLRSGDVVFIPPATKIVEIDGFVNRPAIYELQQGDNLADVIKMAGGAKPDAYLKTVSIERYNTQGLKAIKLIDLSSKQGRQFVVKAGDVIGIEGASLQYQNAITLVGAVTRPGQYQWQQGISVKDLIPQIKGQVKRSADLQYSLVVRENNSSGEIEIIQFSLNDAVNLSDATQNIVLHENDKIIIFNKNDDTQNRYELNKLVQNRIKKISQLSSNSLLGNDLFKAGFAQLEKAELDNKEQIAGVVVHKKSEQSKEQELVSSEVNKMLANLFFDKELIQLSHVLNRSELLFPIIVKLNQQGDAGDSVDVVAVNGPVRYPGVYPLANKGTIKDLVTAAGGLKEGAYTPRAELTRTFMDENGSNIKHHGLCLSSALAGEVDDNIELKGRDVLTVLTTPDWQENQSIEVRGEVKFPGVYNIRRGETLLSVLERAGGYTEYAYLPAAVFVREAVRKQEQIEIKKLADTLRRDIATRGVSKDGNVVNYSEAKLMLADLENIQAVGRLVVDLPALAMGVKQADIQLEDSDVLYVPSTKQTVAVMGEVQHAATHRYKEGLGYSEYISMSGGSRQRADEDRTYIIQANGSVLLPSSSFWFDDNQQLKPGDTIIVPLDTEYKDNLTLWSQVTQIIYNTAVAIATVSNL